MATESVKILIEAEDKATAKLKAAVTEQEKAAAKAEVSRARAQKSIAAERIELEQGAEAAHAFRLELEGLSSAEAALIAREKELLTQQKKRAAEQERLAGVGGAKQTKSGAEFFGAIAGLTGNSEIASVAGQIGGLTEKTSQFSEVAKAGGASAMIFKAGLVGAAAAIGVQVGSSIGNAIFGVEELRVKLAETAKEFDRLEGKRLAGMQTNFKDFITDLEFAPDKTSAVTAELDRIKKELQGVEAAKRDAMKQMEELRKQQNDFNIKSEKKSDNNIFTDAGNAVSSWWNSGEIEASIAQQQQMIDARVKEGDALKANQEELKRLIGIEKERDEKRVQAAQEKATEDYLKSIRDEIEMTKAEIVDATNAINAKNETPPGTLEGKQDKAPKEPSKVNELKAKRAAGETFQSDEALRLLEELDASKKLQEDRKKAEAEKEQFAQKEKARLEAVDALRKSEATRIEEQIIAIEKGKTAAQAFRLEQQGLSKDEAQRIATAQAELDKANQKGGKPQQLQVVESRLLTRGAEGPNLEKEISESSKKSVTVATQQLAEIKELRREMAAKNPVNIKTAS